MEKRYYYKKDNLPAYNLKEPLKNILEDTTGYIEITKEEWDELTYVDEPTQAEIQAEQIRLEISQLKSFLSSTDYIIIKIAEAETEEQRTAIRTEYASVIAERIQARARINELEATL